DRAAREPDDDHAADLAQRPEVVGEAIAAHGVDHDVHPAAGELLDLILPGTVRANDLISAGPARDPAPAVRSAGPPRSFSPPHPPACGGPPTPGAPGRVAGPPPPAAPCTS